jgi:hypothetical protein
MNETREELVGSVIRLTGLNCARWSIPKLKLKLQEVQARDKCHDTIRQMAERTGRARVS